MRGLLLILSAAVLTAADPAIKPKTLTPEQRAEALTLQRDMARAEVIKEKLEARIAAEPAVRVVRDAFEKAKADYGAFLEKHAGPGCKLNNNLEPVCPPEKK